MKMMKGLWYDQNALAVVEAAILFPIMMMIFAGLVLLSMFMPTRAALQRATQYAATALASEKSDTWLFYDADTMTYYWESDKRALDNVYVSIIKTIISGKDDADKAEIIVQKVEQSGISVRTGELTVDFGIVNRLVYKEIIVTATRTMPLPVDLSFIGFPKELPIVVTSTAIVQNGDEFVRNIDIAVDFVKYIVEKYELGEVFESVHEIGDVFKDILGW